MSSKLSYDEQFEKVLNLAKSYGKVEGEEGELSFPTLYLLFEGGKGSIVPLIGVEPRRVLGPLLKKLQPIAYVLLVECRYRQYGLEGWPGQASKRGWAGDTQFPEALMIIAVQKNMPCKVYVARIGAERHVEAWEEWDEGDFSGALLVEAW